MDVITKRLLLFLPLICIRYISSAQPPLLPVYTIKTDTTADLNLPAAYWQIVADTTGTMSVDEVMRSGNFQNRDRKISYKINTYWQRFRLANTLSKEIDIALPVSASSADLYTQTSKGIQTHSYTGTNVRWSQRDGLKRIPAFTFQIPPGDTITIYRREYWNFVTAQPDSMAVVLGFTDRVINRSYLNNDAPMMLAIQSAFLLGLLVLSIVINFYFYLVVREKGFLFFIVFLLFFMLNALSSLNGVFMREFPRLQFYFYLSGNCFSGFVLIHFVRHFLRNAVRHPRWDRFLFFFSFIYVAGLFVTAYAPAVLRSNISESAHVSENILRLIYQASLLITILLYFRSHDHTIRQLPIALLPIVLLGTTTYAIAIAKGLYYPGFAAPDISGHTSTFDQTAYFVLILSYLWMLIFFTWMLFLRFSRLKKDFAHQSELDKLKSKFFANISHEFRTPLTLIIGPVEDLLQKKEIQKFKADLSYIHRSAKRLLQLVNQLLDLSKLDAQNYTINTSRNDIVPFIKQIVHSFSSLAHLKNIELELEIDPRLKNKLRNGDISFYFDDDIMEKILSNLLSNSFKFTKEGGNISVILGLPEKEKKFLELKIEDNGAGIPADKLPYIFERFYQAADTRSGSFDGSGIGLSLAKELAGLHGGKITASSVPGVMTVFTCLFPLNKKNQALSRTIKTADNSATPAYVDDNPENNGSTGGNGAPVVLLAEDQPDVRRYIQSRLMADYHVIEAKDGIEGLAIAKEKIPDIVISDIMMPRMDGFEFCHLLKTDTLTCHIPVILLTARAADADKLNGLETGADVYLIKPFNTRELQLRVHNLIEIRNTMRAKFSGKLIVKPSEITVTSKDRLFIQDLLDIIEKHLDDDTFSVENLGHEVFMSTSQINRKLKALINQPAQQLIRSVRMQRAEELLKHHAGSISEIAYRVGFRDPGYFARVFKTHFGFPPSEIK